MENQFGAALQSAEQHMEVGKNELCLTHLILVGHSPDP